MGLSVGELTGFVDLDSSGVQRGAAAGEAATARMARDVLKQLRKIEAENTTVKVDGEITALRNKIRTVEAYRAQLTSQPWNMEVELKLGQAERDLAKLNAELTATAARRVKIQVEIDKDRITSFGDAVKVAHDKVDKFAAGLGKLAPAASAFTAVGLVPVLLGAAAAAASTAGAVGLLPAVGLAGAVGINALKVATGGFGQAMKDVGDPKKFADDVAKLSPAARATAVSVRNLVPAWTAMKNTVQDKFFAGIAAQVKPLGATYIPMLGASFSTVATGANQAASGVLAMLMQGNRIADVNTIVSYGGGIWHSLFGAISPIAGAIVDIGAVGMPVLQELVSTVDYSAQAFAAFIAKARESGQLEKWIRGGVSAMGDLIGIVKNLGSLVGSVFKAANQDGAGLLQTVRDLTAGWAQWASSAEGQDRLGEVFRALNEILRVTSGALGVILPIIGDLIVWFSQLPVPVQQAVVGFLVWGTMIGKVMQGLSPLTRAIGVLGPKVGSVAGKIVEGASKWGLLGRGAQDAAKLSENGIGKILMAMGRGAAGMMVRAVTMAASWLVAMGPIGWVIAAVIILAGLIIYYWDDIKAATIKLWAMTAYAVQLAWDWIKSIVIGAIVWVVTTVTTWWNTANAMAQLAHDNLVAMITNAWNWLKSIIIGAVVWIIVTVTGWWLQANALAQQAHDALVALISACWEWIKNVVSGAISGVVNFLSTGWSTITSAAQAAWQWLVNLIVSVGQAIVSTVTGWASNVVNFLSNAWSNARNAAANGWESLKGAVINIASSLLGWISGIPGRILSALSSLGSLLVGVGGDLVRGLWNGIVAGWNWLVSAVQNLARSLLNAAMSALGIASPSKKFRDMVGRWIPAGLGDGIIRNAKDATDAARAMASDAVSVAQSEAMQGAAMAASYGASTGPRVLARAGAATASAGDAQAGTTDRSVNVTINNPLPERSSASLNRSARTTAKLGPDSGKD